jgi:SAM-dependent methyltransferase
MNSGVDSFFESPTQCGLAHYYLRRGVLPLKFAFVGSAAGTHDRLARSVGYQEVAWNANRFVRAIKPFIGLAPLSILEIGPGNGVQSAQVLHLLRKGHVVRRYTCIDFSSVLMRRAEGELQKTRVHVERRYHTVDIERLALGATYPWLGRSTNLVLLLGNTICNLEDPGAVLRDLSLRMPRRAILLFNIGLYDTAKSDFDYIRPYRTKEFLEAVLEPLKALDVAADTGMLRLAFDRAAQSVLVHCQSSFGGDQGVPGMPPDIRCFISRRYTRLQVERLVRCGGWHLRRITADPQRGQFICVASPA